MNKKTLLLINFIFLFCFLTYSQQIVVHIDTTNIKIPIEQIDSITIQNEDIKQIVMENILDGGFIINGQKYELKEVPIDTVIPSSATNDHVPSTKLFSNKISELNDKIKKNTEKCDYALVAINNVDLSTKDGDTLFVPVNGGQYFITWLADSPYAINVVDGDMKLINTLGAYAVTWWDDIFNLPDNARYIQYKLNENNKNAFIGTLSNYELWKGGEKFVLGNGFNTSISKKIQAQEIFGKSLNMIDDAEVGTYDGLKSRLFEVKGNHNYYITILAPGQYYWVYFLDANKSLISFLDSQWNTVITTPSNTKYVRIQANPDDAYANTMFWGEVDDYELWNSGYKRVLKDDIVIRYKEQELLKVGIGTNHTDLREAFEYANEHNLGVEIQEGTYNISPTSATDQGLYAPKFVKAYGVVINANLDELNNEFSPLNILSTNKETIIQGLEVNCTNCRYALHDEMYNRTGYYHNRYEDCSFSSNSQPTTEWPAPRAVGGGLGNKANIEFVNCRFNSNVHYGDIDYHSNANGTQTGNCIINIMNCDFKNAVQCTPIGSSTAFCNKMYVNGCRFGTYHPTAKTEYNMQLIEWSNELQN